MLNTQDEAASRNLTTKQQPLYSSLSGFSTRATGIGGKQFPSKEESIKSGILQQVSRAYAVGGTVSTTPHRNQIEQSSQHLSASSKRSKYFPIRR